MALPAIALYAYQKRWLADTSRFKIGKWSRQVGKTFTVTLEAVDDVFEQLTQGRPARWVILSRGERQAKEAIEEGVKRHAQAYGLALDEFEYDFSGSDGAKYRAVEVSFPGGARITALPANPDTARGFSANVILDEFAFHKDSRAIWTALFPVISAGHKLRVVSTPNGKSNKFFELMSGKDDDWSRHIVDIYMAVREGCPRDIDELRRNLMDDDAWSQEYELKWLDEASAWLPYELITSVEDPAAGRPELYGGGACYLGNDIAVRKHLWIAWVWEEVGDVLWTREVRVLKRKKFSVQDAVMDELMERYRVARLAMDQTGMGEKPVEDAKKRYGEHRVEGVLFTVANKLIMATAGKQAFEDRAVRIPAGDPVLRADLHKLKKVSGPTGQPRFVAEADAAGHADYAWGCFLGINAADRGLQPPAGASVEADDDTYLPTRMSDRRRARVFGHRPMTLRETAP